MREKGARRGARMEPVSLRGVSYRPLLGSAYHEHEPSAPSFSFSPSVPFAFSPSSSLAISLPVFPSESRRMQTADTNPPANLHLITTITTGDSRETIPRNHLHLSSPRPRLLRRSLPKRTHGIAFRTIGSRSSLWR